MDDDWLIGHRDTIDMDEEVSEFIEKLSALHQHIEELRQAESDLWSFLNVPAKS